jgi:hypothetical protein
MSVPANSAFDRTAGSHSLAAAGQRGRWADDRMLAGGKVSFEAQEA